VSWSTLALLCAISYALKASGPALAGGREMSGPTRAALDLISVPLLSALILVQTLTTEHAVVLDARAPALAVAAALVYKRAPFLVVVIAAAATAALLRAIS
jgi:branched-subunit amino acid transport protein